MEQLKQGRGFEITLEALLDVLEDRFPEFVPWDRFVGAEVDWSAQTKTLGLYYVGALDDEADESLNPVRVIQEGAPIPTVRIRRVDLDS